MLLTFLLRFNYKEHESSSTFLCLSNCLFINTHTSILAEKQNIIILVLIQKVDKPLKDKRIMFLDYQFFCESPLSSLTLIGHNKDFGYIRSSFPWI